MTSSERHEKCDHDPCHCVPADEGSAVVQGKSVYCSPGCANGKGCDHSDCGCANQSSLPN